MILLNKYPNYIDIPSHGEFEVNSKEEILNLFWIKNFLKNPNYEDIVFMTHKIPTIEKTFYWLYVKIGGKLFRQGEFYENPSTIGLTEYFNEKK